MNNCTNADEKKKQYYKNKIKDTHKLQIIILTKYIYKQIEYNTLLAERHGKVSQYTKRK